MNTIISIMSIYCIASIIYLIYTLFFYKESLKEIVNDIEKYNKIKNHRKMIFILGIIIGLIIVLLFLEEKKILPISSKNIIISDVSDMNVII